jgi:hypothetical protein
LASDQFALTVLATIGSGVIFFGLDQALYYGPHWSTVAARVGVALALALLWAGALGALAWTSANNSEVIPDGGLPRYERWRIRVMAWTGTVILAVVGTAIYGIIAGQ